MSLTVPLDQLRAALAERSEGAYLLTVTGDARPHAVHGLVRWEGDRLVAEVGKRTAANARERSSVSILFPLRTPDDYSVIVDGIAEVASTEDGNRVLVTPTTAVLHRPAAVPDPTSPCDADCVPLIPQTTRR